jgi:RNA polymerase sigma factor (sigma-70 family)
MFEYSRVVCNHEDMLNSREDHEAQFSSIQEKYRRLIRKAIGKVSRFFTDFDLQDIEQEVHIKLWKLMVSGQKMNYPATYVYKMAATTAIDALRKMKLNQPEPVTQFSSTTETSMAILDVLEVALKKIASSRQTAVRLYLQGYSAEEIAQLMDWTSARARNLTYRGLEDLRLLLKQEGIDYERS